jgi:hypothetical protein
MGPAPSFLYSHHQTLYEFTTKFPIIWNVMHIQYLLGTYDDSDRHHKRHWLTMALLLLDLCGGQISPGSTRRMKDLTKGPRAQWIVRPFLRGPGKGQSVKQVDVRPDWCKPGRPTALSKRPQQGSDFPALEPHAAEPDEDRSAES